MAKFPNTHASNLSGSSFELPGDFEGTLNLLFIAFQQWQQNSVNTWLPLAEQLEQITPVLRYYELPVIRRMNIFAQAFIDAGMRAGIPNHDSRGRTITLYLEKDEFRRSLEISDEDAIQVLLVDRAGSVLWSAQGDFTLYKGEALIDALKASPDVYFFPPNPSQAVQ